MLEKKWKNENGGEGRDGLCVAVSSYLRVWVKFHVWHQFCVQGMEGGNVVGVCVGRCVCVSREK